MYCPQHLLCVSTLPCRNNIARFLCRFKMKFAHELCWHTVSITQNCTDQFTNNVHYVLLWAKKNIKFPWEFTKLYQFNVKQMEMCSLFWATLYIITFILALRQSCVVSTVALINECMNSQLMLTRYFRSSANVMWSRCSVEPRCLTQLFGNER